MSEAASGRASDLTLEPEGSGLVTARTTTIVLIVLLGVGLVLGGGFVGTSAASEAPDCGEVSYETNSSGYYEVSSAEELQCIGDDEDGPGLDEDYVLTEDIDASETENWNGGDGFEPIGSGDSIGDPFTGTFDGNEFTISNVTVDLSDGFSTFAGLFGGIDGATIENIGVVDGDITVGTSSSAGGIVGDNENGKISDSYFTGDIAAGDFSYAGGLVGENENGEISNSYFSGDIAAGDSSFAGGLVGENEGTVTNSHYNVETVEINGENAITRGALFDEQFQVWKDDKTLDRSDYNSLEQTADGVEIDDVQGLKDALGFTEDSDTNWILGDDINTTDEPIDLYIPYLAGDFDGNGHTLTVDIEDSTGNEVGAIGFNDEGDITALTVDGSVDSTGTVGALAGKSTGTVSDSVAHAEVTGSGFVGTGGLVGKNDGTIEYSEASGEVDGSEGIIGGLVGRNTATISHSSASANITGNDNDVGGLVGFNTEDGVVSNASSTGKVDVSERRIGGLIGRSSGTVTNSFATGNVDGEELVGGLVGDNRYGGEVLTSYATGTVTGDEVVGGLVGRNGASQENADIVDSYALGTVTGSDSEIGGLVGRNRADITNSYWDIETTNQSDSDGGTGLDSMEMKGEAATENMEGFDFTISWETVTEDDTDATEDSYPILTAVDRQLQLESFDVNEFESIGDWHDLDDVREDFDGTYVLVNDLDEDTQGYDDVASEDANGGAGFEPIGDSTDEFTGEFDGQNNEIEGLFIDRADDEVGLFGVTASGASLERVVLVDTTVTGDVTVGGLVGQNDGTVELSAVSGTVGGDFSTIGGLVGSNTGTVTKSYTTGEVGGDGGTKGGLAGRNAATVESSYSTSAVSGGNELGGLVGFNDDGTVEQSFATGNVSVSFNSGGLVASNQDGGVSDSYWDIETSGQDESAGGTGLTTDQMTGLDALDAGNMEALDDSVWSANQNSKLNGFTVRYPTLADNTQDPAPSASLYAGGDGSEDPYEIENWYHLDNVRENLGADFVLAADLAADTQGYDEVVDSPSDGFEPIGDEDTRFEGTLDGGANTIDGLVIDRSERDYTGLIGYSEQAVVKDLRIENADVHGNEWVGILAGRFGEELDEERNRVENVSVDGIVEAEHQLVGGMIGQPNNADLTNQLVATGTVTGGSEDTRRGIGGLVGRTSNEASVSVAYTNSTVHGDSAGGVIGHSSGNPSTIESVYSASTVEASDGGAVVGVVGSSGDEFKSSVYWDTEVESNVAGDEDSSATLEYQGLTTTEMQGVEAEDNMGLLDFDETWSTVPSAYPVFQWQTAAVDDPDDFQFGDLNATAGEDEVIVSVTENNIPVPDEDIVILDEEDVDDLDGIDAGDIETTDDEGQATFPVTEKTAGSYNVTFALAEDTELNDTATIEINPAPPEDPSAADVTTPLEISNTVIYDAGEDEFGNEIGSGLTVNIVDDDGLDIDLEAETNEDSEASFEFSADAYGTFTLEFEDEDGNTATATVTVDDVDPSQIEHDEEGGVYQVSTPAELQSMGNSANTGAGDDFELANDIDLSAANVEEWNDGAGFDPIDFSGTFEGNGNVIEALYIDRNTDNIGLFGGGGSSSIVIENLRLESIDVTGNDHTAGLAGGSFDANRIENVSVTGTVEGSGSYNAGFVSRPFDTNMDNRNVFRGEIRSSARYVGGLAGRTSGDTSIGDSYVQADIIVEDGGGGDGTGLIMGFTSTATSTFDDLYAAGNITDQDGNAQVGAIAGDTDSGDDFTNIYWDKTLGVPDGDGNDAAFGDGGSGTSDTINVTGLDTDEIQGDGAEANMAFDFEELWVAPTGTYPIFQWQLSAADDPDDLFFGDLDARADDGTIVVSVTDSDIPVPDKKIVVLDEGNIDELDGLDAGETNTTDENGETIFRTTETEAGPYNVTLAVDEDPSINDTAAVRILGNPENLEDGIFEAGDVDGLVGEANEVEVSLEDEFGNVVEDAVVEVTDEDGIAEIDDTATTDDDGVATFEFTAWDVEGHTIEFRPEADSEISTTANISLASPDNIEISLNDISQPVSDEFGDGDELVATVTVVNETEDIELPNIDVELTDNGKHIEVKGGRTQQTNQDGDVEFVIQSTTAQSDLTFTFTEQVSGDDASGTISGFSFIEGEIEEGSLHGETTATAGEADELAVSLTDEQGNPLEDETVVITDDNGLDGIAVDDSNVTDEDGNATFSFEETVAADYELGVTVEDVNLDGTADVTVESAEAATMDAIDTDATAGDSNSVTVEVEDEFDNPVLDETVDLTDADGLSNLDNSATTDDAGEATFSFEEETKDSYTPAFELAADGSITDSATVTIEASEPDDLELANDDITVDAGDEDEFELTLTDEFDNALDGETIEVTADDGLSGLDSFNTTDEDGQVAFAFEEDVAGSYTVDFSVQSDPGITTTGDVTVEGLEVDSVELLDPVATAGDQDEFTAIVTDEFDNPVAGETVDIDDDGGLSGIDIGNNATTDSDGEATFSFEETTAGSYTVEASVDGHSGVNTTNEITVEAADTDDLSVGLDGLTTTVSDEFGDGWEFTPTVSVVDEFENPVPNTEIELDPDGDDIDIQDGTVQETNDDGEVEYVIQSPTPQDGVRLTFTEAKAGEDLTVSGFEFEIGAVENGSLDAATVTETAGEAGEIDLTLTDHVGNALEDETIEVTADEDLDGLDTGETRTTGEDGEVAFSFDEETAGTYAPAFEVDGASEVNETASVTIDPDTADSVSIDDMTVDAGEEGTIVATVQDEFDNPVPDETVESSNIDGLLGLGSSTDTDEDGEATFTFEEESAGEYDIEVELAADADTNDTATVAVSETAPKSLSVDDVIADAGDTGTFELELTDESGNSLEDETITVTDADGLSGVGDDDTATTDANGESTFIFEETTAGGYDLTFDVDSSTVTAQATATVDPLDADSLSVDDVTVDAGDEGTLTATVTDEFGNTIEGETVDVTDDNELSGLTTSSDTNSDGQTTFTFEESTAGDYDIEFELADDTSVTETATVTVSETASESLSVDDATVEAGEDGELTATVTDENGNPITGETVNVTADDGLSGLPASNDTDSAGEATFAFDEEDADTYVVEFDLADDTSVTDTATVTVTTADPDSLSVGDVAVDAGDPGTLIATVTDEFDNAIEDETVDVVSDDDLSGLDSSTDTDSHGEATFSFQEDSAGEYTVEIELEADQTVFDTATVNVSETAPDSLSVNDQTVDAGENGTFELKVTDAAGNPLENETVLVDFDDDISKIDGHATTDSSGIATIDFREEDPGGYTVDFSVEGTSVFASAGVTVGTAAVDSFVAEGTFVSSEHGGQITVALEDEFGNDVADERVTVADDDGLDDLDHSAETNASGVATLEFDENDPGEYTVLIELDADTTVNATASVTVEAPEPDRIEVTEPSVTADDPEGTISATVLDQFDEPMEAETVEIVDDDGLEFVDNSSQETDSSGIVSYEFEDRTADEYDLIFGANAIEGTGTVTVEPGSPHEVITSLPPGLVETVSDTFGDGNELVADVTVFDTHENTVPGVDVQLTSGDGQNLDVEDDDGDRIIETDSDGVATFVVQTTTAQKDIDLTFTELQTGDGEDTILRGFVFEPGPPDGIDSTPVTTTAGDAGDLTIEVVDQFGNAFVPTDEAGAFVEDDAATVAVTDTDGLMDLENATAETDENGKVIFSYSETVADDYAVEVDIDNGTATGTADVTVEADEAVDISADDMTATAGDTDHVVVTAFDQFDNPAPDTALSVSDDGGLSGLGGTETTNNTGDGAFTFTETTVGEYTAKFELDADTNVTDDATVIVDPADGTELALDRSTGVTTVSDEFDDGNEVTLTLTVEDDYGNVVPDTTVEVSDDGDDVVADGDRFRETDENGTVDVTVQSTTAQENVTLTLTEQETGVQHAVDTEVTFEADDPHSVAADDETVDAGEEGTVTAAVVDQFGNVLDDESVVVTDDAGLTDFSGPSDSGAVTYTFEEETAGDYTVAFEADSNESITSSATVTIAPLDPDQLIESLPRSIVEEVSDDFGDGNDIEITITAEDEFGNPVPGTLVEFDDNGDSIEVDGGDEQTTDDNGQATFIIQSTVAQTDRRFTFTERASDDEISITIQGFGFEAGPVDAVELSPGTDQQIVAGDSIELDATAVDRFGNVIEGDNGEFDWTNTTSGNELNEPTADDYDVTAEFAGVTSDPTTVTVEPAAPDALAIDTEPGTDQIAGDALMEQPTVLITDEFGNPVPDETVDVALNGSTTLTGTTTVETDENGLATFDNIAIEETGSYTLTFEADGGALDDESDTFEVGPAEVDDLDLDSQPSELTAGESVDDLSITVTDAFGNTIEGESIDATLAGSATLDGTTTLETDADGVVVFDDLSIEEAGTYTLTFEAEDGTTVTTDTFTVDPAAVDTVEIDPDTDQTIAADETIQFEATAYDEFGNLVEDDDSAFDWTNADGNGLFEETSTGDYDVSAELDGVTADVTTVTVESAAVDSVETDPDTDQSITAGDTVEFKATAYDEFGNLVEDDDSQFTWTNTGSTGTFDNTTAGSYDVTATLDGEASATITVTVESADVETVEIDPESGQMVTAGDTIQFNAAAFDEFGNLVKDEDSAFDWNNANSDGTFGATDAGDYDVTATTNGVTSDATTVTVNSAAVDRVEIDPDSDQTITAGDTIQLEAIAFDEFDNVVEDDDGQFDWSNASNEGIFDNTTAGSYDVTAAIDGVTNTTTVTVESDDVDTIEIEPDSDQTITAGDTIEFEATAYDEFGNLVENDDSAFDWTNADDNGLFDETTAGSYDVTASFNGEQSAATTVTVEAAALDSVEIDPYTDQTITAGDDIQFDVTAFDEFGNLVEDDDTQFTWTNADTTGTFDETTAGSYEVTAELDGEESASTIVTVEPAAVERVEIETDDNQIITAGGTVQFEATAYDEFDNLVETDDSAFDWSNATDGLFNETAAGTYDVTAKLNGEESAASTVIVEPAAVDRVEIETDDELTITAGETVQFEATAYDEFDNIVQTDDEQFTWQEATTDGTFDQTTAGTYEVTAELDGEQSVASTVTVGPNAVDRVEIETDDDQTITAGETVQFEATAYDQFGNVVEDDDSAFDWTNANGDGLFDETSADTYTVTAEFDDVVSSSTTVTVEPTAVDSVEIDPAGHQTITAGETVQFDATAYDEFGNIVEDDNSIFDWMNADTHGMFNETTAGDYEVSAELAGDQSAVTAVTIEPAEVDRVEIIPESDQTITAGDTIGFEATAYDEFDNLVEDDDSQFDWSTADGDGTFTETSAGTHTVSATLDDETSTPVTVTVNPAALETVVFDQTDDQTITAGDEVSFSATARDRFGNVLEDNNSRFTWTNTTADGTFQNTTAGTYTVRAAFDGEQTDPVTVSVEPGEVDRVEIDPVTDLRIAAGDTVEFNATAIDPFDNIIDDDDSVFNWENATANGTFENETIGTYEVTATYDHKQSPSTTVTVVDSSPSVEDYANEHGVVEIDGVRDAINDWQADIINTDLLIDVIDAWASGSPVF